MVRQRQKEGNISTSQIQAPQMAAAQGGSEPADTPASPLAVVFRAPSRRPAEELAVLDEILFGRAARTLRFLAHGDASATVQSAVPLVRASGGGALVPDQTRDLLLPYHRAMLACAVAALRLPAPPALRVLVVGLGAGALVTALDAALPLCAPLRGVPITIDAVDIDAGVVFVAAAHCGYAPSPRVRTAVGDGAAWLRARPATYHLIMLDVDAKAPSPPPAAAAAVHHTGVSSASEGGGLVAPAPDFCSDAGVRALACACADGHALCVVNVLRPQQRGSSAAAADAARGALLERCARHFSACAVATFAAADVGACDNELLLLRLGDAAEGEEGAGDGGSGRGSGFGRGSALLARARGSCSHRGDIMSLTHLALTPVPPTSGGREACT